MWSVKRRGDSGFVGMIIILFLVGVGRCYSIIKGFSIWGIESITIIYQMPLE